METGTMEGRCLCGAVGLRAPPSTHVEVCHCGMCRRWGGGPMMVVHCGPELEIDGETSVSQFDSSDWATRGFCRQCGTHLYYHLKPANVYVLPVGLFQGQADFVFTEQIYIDSKPDFYQFANETGMLTEAEVMAKYGAV